MLLVTTSTVWQADQPRDFVGREAPSSCRMTAARCFGGSVWSAEHVDQVGRVARLMSEGSTRRSS